MLSVKSKVCDRKVEGAARSIVLERLEEKGLTPLIRAMRLAGFEQALLGGERVREMERMMAARPETDADAPYVRGDLFFFEDYAFFLIFGDAETDAGLRAGVVYGAEAEEPERRLEVFCRNVEAAVGASDDGESEGGANGASAADGFAWREREESVPESFTRFASAGQGEAIGETRGVGAAEHIRAVELLEDPEARRLLRRLGEAQAEGRTSDMLLGAGGVEGTAETLVVGLASAGLARRELLISCRKDAHPLFRLPSTDALAVMTASNAVCSVCGSSVADERAEELVTPTPLATAMLKDGAWLLSRLRAVLVELGVADTDIAARPAAGESDALMMANVGGYPFLFVLRDGEFALPHARRAVDAEVDMEVAHLVVVATGKVQDDARARMREHQKRRSRTGGELELTVVEGVDAAASELRRALERVTRRALAAELFELDAGLGMNAGHFVATRFRLTQKAGALQDLAASAAGALAGSLREI